MEARGRVGASLSQRGVGCSAVATHVSVEVHWDEGALVARRRLSRGSRETRERLSRRRAVRSMAAARFGQ
jgi:hypothetical protein